MNWAQDYGGAPHKASFWNRFKIMYGRIRGDPKVNLYVGHQRVHLAKLLRCPRVLFGLGSLTEWVPAGELRWEAVPNKHVINLKLRFNSFVLLSQKHKVCSSANTHFVKNQDSRVHWLLILSSVYRAAKTKTWAKCRRSPKSPNYSWVGPRYIDKIMPFHQENLFGA